MIIHQGEAEDLGPALSVEDALTVMVVILVLRVVLFVPLMSIDRARLDHAEKETLWQKVYAYVQGHKAESKVALQYEEAFDLGGKAALISDVDGNRARYIEAADGSDNLLVVRHDIEKQSYYTMYVQKFSNVPSYTHGKIKWSPHEKKWFTLNNQVDYNQTPELRELHARYLEWVKRRGQVK